MHTTESMPLSLTVSCFSKIQIGFTFLVPAHQGSPGKRAVKRVCVCVCVPVSCRRANDERRWAPSWHLCDCGSVTQYQYSYLLTYACLYEVASLKPRQQHTNCTGLNWTGVRELRCEQSHCQIAEVLYYKQQFDTRANSVKQLWSNLNKVFNYKKNQK